MTTTMDFKHNVDDVIDDIDDIQRDLYDVFRSVRRVMSVVADTARAYIRTDSEYTGQLRKSVGVESDPQEDGVAQDIKVTAGGSIAPYAAIVEFGSGSKSNTSWEGSPQMPPPDSEEQPPGYPFESPDIEYNYRYPWDMSGYPTFYGFVMHIKEWMDEKPVDPQIGVVGKRRAAVAVAREIIERGQFAHPFLRPAWFQHELKVKQTARTAVKKAVR